MLNLTQTQYRSGISLLLASVAISVVGLIRYRTRTRYPKTCRVTGLFLYPVKGFRGNDMSSKSVTAHQRGFEHDRRFMVVDEEGNFTTQRENPGMATVRCDIVSNSILKLTAAVRIDLLKIPNQQKDGSSIAVTKWTEGPKRTVRVWRSMVDNAVDQGDEAAAFVTRAIGTEKKYRLVFMGEDAHRSVNEAVAPNHEVSFADGYPFLVASTSSLADLNRRIEDPKDRVPMERFRPNIVVDGLFPWTEDLNGTRLIFKSGHVLKFIKPCDRCKVTTIDQQTGAIQPSQEPLKTLKTFRRIKGGMEVFFATNAVLEKQGSGPIELGEVEIDWFDTIKI